MQNLRDEINKLKKVIFNSKKVAIAGEDSATKIKKQAEQFLYSRKIYF